MLLEFLRDQRELFFQNAQTVRDRRTQMRGNRAMLLFLAFTFVLALVTGLSLGDSLDRQVSSLADFQGRLRDAQNAVFTALTVLVGLVAPVLTCGAVITERTRKSLDLIQSAPIPPQYFLVGKLLGAYRYLWVLLILTVPFTASTVVFGGATAWDVVVLYWHLSCMGLLGATLGLLASTVADSMVKAVVLAYVYSWGTSTLLGFFVLAIGGGARLFMGSRSANAGDVALALLTGNRGPMAGLDWSTQAIGLLLYTVISVLLVAFLISGSVSGLVARAGRHTAVFRVLAALLLGSVSLVAAITARGTSGAGIASFGFLLLGLIAFVPKLSCYGPSTQKRTLFDGTANWRETLSGRPSGGIFYIGLLFLLLALPHAVGVQDPYDLGILGYSLAVVFGAWGLCRWTSSFSASFTSATGMSLAWLSVPFAVLPVIVAILWSGSGGSAGSSPFGFTPYGPVIDREWPNLIIWSIAWALFGAVALYVSNETTGVKMVAPPKVRS